MRRSGTGVTCARRRHVHGAAHRASLTAAVRCDRTHNMEYVLWSGEIHVTARQAPVAAARALHAVTHRQHANVESTERQRERAGEEKPAKIFPIKPQTNGSVHSPTA